VCVRHRYAVRGEREGRGEHENEREQERESQRPELTPEWRAACSHLDSFCLKLDRLELRTRAKKNKFERKDAQECSPPAWMRGVGWSFSLFFFRLHFVCLWRWWYPAAAFRAVQTEHVFLCICVCVPQWTLDL